MRYLKKSPTVAAVLFAALNAAGCDRSRETAQTSATPVPAVAGSIETAHVHKPGPSGEVVFDVGRFHAEFTADRDTHQFVLLFLDGTQPTPVAGSNLTLFVKQTTVKQGPDMGKQVPAMTIRLRSINRNHGKATTFVGRHPPIDGYAEFEGSVVGEIDGQQVQGTFKE